MEHRLATLVGFHWKRRRRRTGGRASPKALPRVLAVLLMSISASAGVQQESRGNFSSDQLETTLAEVGVYNIEQKMDTTIVDVQPRLTRVEKGAASAVIGSVSMYEGSPWCPDDAPMYWLVGHQHMEHPWCYDRQDGGWKNSSKAVLEIRYKQFPKGIKVDPVDRHDCVTTDVNKDGLVDLVCFVGARKGKGLSHQELYLTEPPQTESDTERGDHGGGPSSLVKVKSKYGLSKYNTLSTRVATKLRHVNGNDLIFVGNNGRPRRDHRSNAHRMFEVLESGEMPYFRELRGPWTKQYPAECAVTADINNDGLDDLIVCRKQAGASMYVQNGKTGMFSQVKMPKIFRKWRNVRVGFVTGNALPDLVVAEEGNAAAAASSYVRIYRGIPNPPYFRYEKPYYQLRLPHAAPDVEIFDFNHDGIADLFVLQVDETHGYCAARGKFNMFFFLRGAAL